MRSVFDVNGLVRRTDGISIRATQAVVSPIKEMALLAEKVEGVVSIGWGLPSFETPEYIRSETVRALDIDKQLGKYPNIMGLANLRQAISDRFQTRSNVLIDSEKEVLVTVGAQQALFAALMTIVNPGDEVILLAPVFPSYIDQIIYAGGIPVFVDLLEENSWKLDIQKIEDAISKHTKAIIVNFPANPTGVIFSKEELQELSNLAIKHHFFIISDETYRFLYYGVEEPFNLFKIPELKNLLIGCYSFSKEYAMTGWRVGYLCAEGGLIQEILKLHDASVITAPRISQIAAWAAMQGNQETVVAFRNELNRRRKLMADRLDKLSQIFEYTLPEGAYYFFPKIISKDINSYDLALKLLYDAKVITIPGGAFGPIGENHLRLCFAVSEAEITQAFDRLEKYFNNSK